MCTYAQRSFNCMHMRGCDCDFTWLKVENVCHLDKRSDGLFSVLFFGWLLNCVYPAIVRWMLTPFSHICACALHICM